MSTLYPSKWSARSSVVHLATSAQLKNCAAATFVAGTEWDNSSGDQLGDFEFNFRGADVFHAGDCIQVWLLIKAGGTNLEVPGTAGADAAATHPPRPPDLIFSCGLVNTQQIVTMQKVPLPAGKVTPLILSPTNHGFTNTDAENFLELYTYNNNVVAP
jgi:hypothetical protein